MSQNGKLSPQQQDELTSSWEQSLQKLDARLRASGRTVTVTDPSDTNEFVVTFPQAKRDSAAPRDESPSTHQLEPVDLDAACQVLVRPQAVLALLKESFDPVEFDEVVGLMRAGRLEGDLSGELENLLEDEVGNNFDEVWSGIIRQPHDDYAIGVYGYEGVFWVKSAEYDRVSYFLEKESAIAYAKSHWQVSKEGDDIDDDKLE